jgi:uncharacterized protein YukJ
MPVVNYGLLRGAVINSIPYQKGGDHYQIEISAAGKLYRVAIDVYSEIAGTKLRYSPQGLATLDQDRLVLFYKDEHYTHPMLTSLLQAAEGLTPRAQLPQQQGLDYLRTVPALFPIDQMKLVPPKDANGDGNDLNGDLDPWIKKAANNPQAELFVFGSSWDDSLPGSHPDPNPYWKPDPLLGVHDAHMNQGDTGSEEKTNGVWQDGGLFIRFGSAPAAHDGTAAGGTPAADTWVAMFFRFQSQSTTTDNNGNPK